MIKKSNVLKSFLELVEINSESANERLMANFLIEKLTEMGIEAFEDDAQSSYWGNCGNVIGFYKGTETDLPPILFSSHMDTIEPTTGIKIIVEDDIVRTDGTTILGGDDRAGVAIILETLRYIIKNKIPSPPIKIIFSVGEEIGMYGSSFYKDFKPKTAFGFVFDCSADPGKVIANAPTSIILKIKVNGKSSHAAVHPDKGINAIKMAAHAISKVEVGRVSDTCTVNFGVIHGGKATNIVPELVTIDAEVRSFSDEEIDVKAEEIKSAFNQAVELYGGSVDVNACKKYNSFKLSENDEIIKLASEALRNNGFTPESIKYTGGSDANQFNAKGIPTVNLSLGLKNVHSHLEHLNINDITAMANTAIEIINTSVKYLNNKKS